MPAKFDRCVRKVKSQNKYFIPKVNPYAVCNAAMKKNNKTKQGRK